MKQMTGENMQTGEDHFGGMLAKLPAGNPSYEEMVSHERYTITPIEHDYAGKTPAMWNAAYRHFGLDAAMAMVIVDPRNAERIFQGFREDAKYLGGGSGVGWKDEAVKFLDELSPLAKAVGSVNLIQKLPSGKLKGWNTDGIGYRQSLEDLLGDHGASLRGAKVVILGAGGTGNAVALALAESGANIVILNRTIEKAEELARRVNDFVGKAQARAGGEDAIVDEVRDADVVINVSTKGATGAFEEYSALAPAKLPATEANILENKWMAEEVISLIPKSAILSDVVLRATPSPFLEAARVHGFAMLDGVPMVVNQGVEAFLILHGDELGRTAELYHEVRELMRKATNF